MPEPIDDLDRRIAEALRDLGPEGEPLEAPPAGLWARIEEATADDPGAPADPDDGRPVEPAALPAVVPMRRRRPPSLTRWVALAAAVLVIVALAAVLVRPSGNDEEVAASARLSPAGLPAGERGARGDARLLDDDGRRHLQVDVDGLADAQGFYEVWLLRPDLSGLQPLGTTEGSGDFVVPDGLDLSSYSIVDISLEPLDGNPDHSGKSVLRGELS